MGGRNTSNVHNAGNSNGSDLSNQFLAGLTQLLQDQSKVQGDQIQQLISAQASQAQNRTGGSNHPIHKQFKELGPKEFSGTTDPLVAEGWIRSLEVIFDFMTLEDADRVRCTTFMFRDDARLWWDGARLSVNLETLTWKGFKDVFYRKYFTEDTRARLSREFLKLRQGTMTVAEYVKKIERGRYFVPLISQNSI